MEKEKTILYHSSHKGIIGDIAPVSREDCDFGRGFYLGTIPEQTKAIVANDKNPWYYEIGFKNPLLEKDVLRLKNYDWVYAVLACRNDVQEFSKLNVCRDILKKIQQYDYVWGPIADDSMAFAFEKFEANQLTDRGLMYCLQKVRLGYQLAVRTEKGCQNTVILTQRELSEKDRSDAVKFAQHRREEGLMVVQYAMQTYKGQGKFLEQLITEEQKKFQLSRSGEER